MFLEGGGAYEARQGASSSLSRASSGTTSITALAVCTVVARVIPSQPHDMHHRTPATLRTGRSIRDRTGTVSAAQRGQSRPDGRKRYRRMNGESSIAAQSTVTKSMNMIASSRASHAKPLLSPHLPTGEASKNQTPRSGMAGPRNGVR